MGVSAFSGEHRRAGRPWRHHPLPSTSLRRQTVPCSHSLCADAVHRNNHTVRFSICASGQHGFVGQAWSGPGVGICPTRRPLRMSRHVPAHGWWAVKGDTLAVMRTQTLRDLLTVVRRPPRIIEHPRRRCASACQSGGSV